MSAFDSFQAGRLAAMTFRFKADKFISQIQQNTRNEADCALVGKENELLEVLLAGEQRYLECKRELEIIGSLRRSDRELPTFCIQMANDLAGIRNRFCELDDIARGEMDAIAHCLNSSAEEMHACFNKLQQWFDAGRRPPPEIVVSAGEKTAGRKPGISNAGVMRLPLEEFAKKVRNFLISPDVRIGFSFEAITRHDRKGKPREPVSAAARLLYEAALLIDPRVEVADIDEVMRAVHQNPEFREELLEDEMVAALTG